MAKKSGVPSYYSGPNAGLIQGARRNVNPISVDLQSTLQGLSQTIAANNARRESRRQAAEAKAATYLGAMESIDMGIVPETYRGGVQDALTNYKNQYFEATMALKNTSPNHPDYLNLKEKLNSINNSIRKVAGTFSNMAKNRKEDLEFISNRNYSSGNNPDKVDFISNVLTGGAGMNIDEYGNVMFDNNGNWTSYDNLPDVAAYDAGSFDQVLTVLDGASRLNRKLTDTDRTLYKSKLQSIIKKGGRNTAISLGSDDFLVDGGMGLGGEEDYDANPEAYKERLLNSYMSLFENAANESAQRYNARLTQQGRQTRSKNIPAAFSRLMEAMSTNPTGAVGGSLEADLAIPGLDVNPKKYKVGWDGNKVVFTDAANKDNVIAYDISDFYTNMWGLDVPEVFKPAPPVGQTNTAAEPVQGLPGGKPIGPVTEGGKYDSL